MVVVPETRCRAIDRSHAQRAVLEAVSAPAPVSTLPVTVLAPRLR